MQLELILRRIPDTAVVRSPPDKWPRRAIAFVVVLIALPILAAVWYWTPLNEWIAPGRLQVWLVGIDSMPAQLLMVIGGFVIAGFLMLPVSVMVVVTALVFGPWWGFLYSWIGAIISAAAGYAAGHVLGRHAVRRMGRSVNRISMRLARRGGVAIFLLQSLPIAPYTIVNLVAGASHIRFRDFMAGTALGLVPGTLAVAVFASSLMKVLTDPEPRNLILLSVAIIMLGGLIWVARRWLTK